MSDLTDAIDAAIDAAALAMYFDPRSAQRNRDMAERAIAAAAPLIEAAARRDERAKVSEEIARAIDAQRRPGITAMLEGGWNHAIEVAAGIARETAAQGSARVQEATNGPDAYPSEGPGVSDAHRAAQTDDRQER